MNKLIKFIGLMLVLVATSQALATTTYTRIIVFGDSYSDNGNVFKLTQGSYPNATRYYQGRFADGPTWVEYLAAYFKINPADRTRFIDLAYGQAKVLAPASITVQGKPNQTYNIPDLAQQIDTYQNKYKSFNPKDLVVVAIATNDFFDWPVVDAPEFFQRIADAQIKQVNRLIKLGAKSILVLNGRDVTYSRLAGIFAGEKLSEFRDLIQLYNQRLTAGLSKKTGVMIYDTFRFDDRIIQRLNQGGITYTIGKNYYAMNYYKASCYEDDQGDYQGIAGKVCSDPSRYFYYDRIHTTSYANYLLAEDIYRHFFIT